MQNAGAGRTDVEPERRKKARNKVFTKRTTVNRSYNSGIEYCAHVVPRKNPGKIANYLWLHKVTV